MEQDVKPFEKFFPGSHLILGEAGTGKTKLIWSILQDREYVKENTINIVLTDSDQRMWEPSYQAHVTMINPYDPDISWTTNPSKPGIYYCACDYTPRMITFLECLATWAIQKEDKIKQKVRVFIDISSRTWALPEFIEQVTRLHYISTSQNEDSALEIWALLGSLKKLTEQAKAIFSHNNLILINPTSPLWLDELKNEACSECEILRKKVYGIKKGKEGYYYVPYGDQELYFQPNFSV